jgi:hypothetical protein
MKKLITVLLTTILFIASSAYAKCYLKEVDVNNKFEAAMTLLDVIKVIENNDAQIKKAHEKASDAVIILIAYKQENIDFTCAIKQLNKFDATIKNNIKDGLVEMHQYLKQKVQFNLDVIDALTSDSFSNLNKFENQIADLAIKANELNEYLMGATLRLVQIIQFEKIDYENASVPDVNGKYYKQIWITDDERTLLLKKLIEFIESKGTSNVLTLWGLGLFVKHLSYENKDLETIEVIKNKYKK